MTTEKKVEFSRYVFFFMHSTEQMFAATRISPPLSLPGPAAIGIVQSDGEQSQNK